MADTSSTRILGRVGKKNLIGGGGGGSSKIVNGAGALELGPLLFWRADSDIVKVFIFVNAVCVEILVGRNDADGNMIIASSEII